MSDRPIRFTVEFNITLGKFDAFERAARDMTRETQPEPGTLVYDWYLSRDHHRARLLEEYVDADAVVAQHEGRVVTTLVPKLRESAHHTRIEVYGDTRRRGSEILSRLGAELFPDWHAIDR